MNNIDLFKEFNNIKISSICKDLNIDYSNLMHGRVTKEKELKVKNALTRKVAQYFLNIQFGVDDYGK